MTYQGLNVVVPRAKIHAVHLVHDGIEPACQGGWTELLREGAITTWI